MEETVKDTLVRVADGNIGALSILLEALTANQLLGLALIHNLDRIGLRGPKVWNLSLLAGRDPVKTAKLLLNEEVVTTLKASEDLDWPTMKRLAATVGTEL